MSGCPHDIPAMRISKGGDSDRPQVSNDVSSGHLMYNTDHNYLEIYHSDSNNPTGWRDLIINNKEQIDISGTVRCDGSLVVLNDFSLIGHAHLNDISVNSIGPVDGSLIILGDISVNGQIFSSGGLVGGGGSGKDASFNVIQEFLDGSGIKFLNDVSFNQDVTITGDLTIDGSFNFNKVIQNITTVNNELLISTQLDICNQGTGPAIEVTQLGNGVNNDIALFKSSVTDKAFEIKDDGKAIFYKDVSFNQDASFTTIRADKILYSNMYDNVSDLPTPTTYHGMFAHVHSTHGAYFSHAGNWVQLADLSRVEDLSLAVDAGAGGGGSREDVSINSAAITFLAGLLYDLSLSVDAGAGGISPGQDVSFHDIDASGYIAADGNIAAGGDITAVGDITAFFSSSDERLKKNIYDISNYENIIKNVRGVRFNWNDEAKNINSNVDLSKVELGVIAQEVEDYIPEIIKHGIGKYKAVRYEKITPILIECIKDLYTKVEKLEEEVRILKM